MVLEFSQSLFRERKVVTQGTSELKEQWNQEDRTIFNDVEHVSGSDETIYTVTTGKVLYIKSIIIAVGAVGYDGFQLTDSSGGTVKFDMSDAAVTKGVYMFEFNVPLKFTTNIYFNQSNSGAPNAELSTIGWEE